MKRRSLFFFFVLPFLGIIVIFFAASVLNRADIKRRTETLVRDQLEAAAHILQVNIAHLIADNRSPEAILRLFEPEEDIYFMALLDEKKTVLAWNSRFEGYLPLSLEKAQPGDSNIIDSPAGQIFSVFSLVTPPEGRRHYLYLGYALTNLEDMMTRVRKNNLLFFTLLVLVGALLFRGISLLQSRYFEKMREAEAERVEKERFREVSAFTSGVAHEIKNPLNSLSLLMNLLQKGVPPHLKDDVDSGKAEIQNIAHIVDRFSNAAKPIQIHAERFSPAATARLVKDSIDRDEPRTSDRVRMSLDESLTVDGDKELLSLVLGNIVKNALEADDRAQIEVDIQKSKRNVLFIIRDSGPGIPPEDISRVFDPFFSTKSKGMGIGLYLARKIVEAHGGTINVRNREGGGAEFAIILPGARHE